MVIYADVVFFVNLISAAALLYLSAILTGKKVSVMRLILASSLSGVYAVFDAVFALPYIFRAATLFCMSFISCGRVGIVLNTSLIMLTSVLLEAVFMLFMTLVGANGYIRSGVITVFAGGTFAMLFYALSFPVVYTVSLLFKKRLKKRAVNIKINGRSIQRTLLYDSGNLLTYKGLSVAVVSWNTISELLSETSYQEFLENTTDRVLYSTVGKVGMLPAIKPDKCTVDGSLCDIYIAVSDNGFLRCGGIIGDIKSNHFREEEICSFSKDLQKNSY